MAKSFWLIDGYNLMHALNLARRGLAQGELEKRRDRFLNLIASRFTPDERTRITIVFDARDQWVGGEREQTRDGMRLIYPEAITDADAEIERLLASHSSPRQLQVISSDRRLQAAAQRRKARAVTSEEFERELSRREETGRRSEERTQAAEVVLEKGEAETSEADRDYWLSVFGEVQDEISEARRSESTSGSKQGPKPRKPRG